MHKIFNALIDLCFFFFVNLTNIIIFTFNFNTSLLNSKVGDLFIFLAYNYDFSLHFHIFFYAVVFLKYSNEFKL